MRSLHTEFLLVAWLHDASASRDYVKNVRKEGNIDIDSDCRVHGLRSSDDCRLYGLRYNDCWLNRLRSGDCRLYGYCQRACRCTQSVVDGMQSVVYCAQSVVYCAQSVVYGCE